ncbi:hypothetical protein DDV21_001120 [Streptococcus chenjunshii]|uniref:Bacteriocin immunity protein n=1 Tax=Streptococcus chenjunshii TaxID=2173853 RepID=A0A372KK86_9STRE|nr:hypothetical protein [Streptococcus chenjunshii]AXQ77771.1 hypothetical protein DDV21_001120 [Streptococcus chenjunshii]RFU50493.1 hypothetical protein DDV22_08455 [Streptococcus chenjunshii]RFU52721.1 hypothetical protein DDV23_08295 [Streptococcus chenjunshii]
MAQNEQDKKVLHVAQELAELLTTHKYEESWEKAGELNGLLKSREGLTLPSYMLDMLNQHLKSYYYQNNVINKAHKAQSAIGHKLAEFR